MIFHPMIISLYAASVLMGFMLVYSSCCGIRILRRWDLKSGSETQLILERKTYLISTLLTYFLGAHLLSLFLFIFTADRLHTFFAGAMCAAGVLHVNGYGYPALLLKIVNFLAGGLWLILNAVDNRGYDYPLTKGKYRLLLFIAPLTLADAALQTNFFSRLRPEIITSCCGTLFSSSSAESVISGLDLPLLPAKIAFILSILLTLSWGLRFYRRGKGGLPFSILSGVTLLVSIVSVILFISPYFYELPTHQCPFCILQREYGYIGYPLYSTLIGAALTGMGVGILLPFRGVPSLSEVVPRVQRRLALASVILLMAFGMIVAVGIAASGLKM